MPRKKHVIEEVADKVVEEANVDAEAVVEKTEATDSIEAKTATESSNDHEVAQKVADKKLHIELTSIYGLSGLRIPVGFDKRLNEDVVVETRIRPYQVVNVVIPAECDAAKWLAYYRSQPMKTVGLRINKYEEK